MLPVRVRADVEAKQKGGAMEALVVYESLFGNTARIGEGICRGLIEQGIHAKAVGVDTADRAGIADVELLVVGGPTHAHGMSRAQTRNTAATDKHNTFEKPTLGPGLKAWLEELPPGQGRMAAAFDTRIGAPVFLTGSAAKGIGHRLEAHGYRLAVGPESFIVTKENTLVEGEEKRTRAWASTLAETLSARH
jgi:hypothetical protein